MRSEVPDPFGATMITSMSAGGTTPVRSFHVMPYGDYSSIGEEAHDDGRFLTGFFDAEECLSRFPSVGYRFFVGFSGTLSDNNIEAVVA